MSRQAMAEPQTKAAPQTSASLLQRRCACGRHTGGAQCEGCRKEKGLQRQVGDGRASAAPPMVQDVLGSAGQELPAGVRALLEPRFGRELPGIRPARRTAGAQFELAVNRPGDAWEQNADQVAARVLAPAGPAPTEGSASRYDLSGVRIHTDARAAESARSVNALAYTVGRHVVFGAGQYTPETEAGRQLLAHELTHVVQQGGGPGVGIFRRLDPSDCSPAERCGKPDKQGAAGPPSSYKLTVAVDREQEGLGRLVSGNVGHTWVKLSDDVGTLYSYGFWPETGFNAKKPFQSVAGCVHHPDTAHEPPNATKYIGKDYTLPETGYLKALSHAKSVCETKPKYNLFTYNCTSFAIDVAEAAGVTPPSSTTLAVHNPNALYEGIEKDRKAGHPKTGALIGGLGGLALGIGIGSLLGPAGAIVGGLIGGLAGAISGALIGDKV